MSAATVTPIRSTATPIADARPHFADDRQYQSYYRTVKAARVAKVLIQIDADAATLTDDQWGMAAQVAGVNPLGAEARAAVVALMTVLA